MTKTRHLAMSPVRRSRRHPGITGVLVLLVGPSAGHGPALAEDGSGSNRPVSLAMTRPAQQPRSLVDLMPAELPALLVAPKLADVLGDLDALNRILAPVHPEWDQSGLHGELLERLVGGSSLLPGSDRYLERLRALMSNEGLVEAGIDPLGPLVLAPDLDARVLLFGFELVDRPQFERWLAHVGGADRRRVKVGGEVATVVAPRSSAPTTCLARRAYALCQVAVPAEGDPIQPLRRMVAFRGPRLGVDAGASALRRALDALPAGAHLYAAGATKKLAPLLARMVAEAEARAHRFAQPDRRRDALAHAARMRTKIETASKMTDGLAVGLYARPKGMEIRLQANLTILGRELLTWWLPSRRGDGVIERWTRTPALVRLVASAKPELIEAIASSFGWSPPKGALTGDVGLLSMGLDTLCGLAKQTAERRTAGDATYWGFVFPSALALGIHSRTDANQIHRSMAERLERDRDFDWRARDGGRRAATDRPRLGGHFNGSPVKVQVLDELMLVGMGPGIASAAVRRLGALPAARSTRPSATSTFLEVSVYPRSLDAAFAAAHVGPQHRRSLRSLAAWRLRWKPLLTRFREVRLTARLEPKASQPQLIVTGVVLQ